MMRWIGLAVIAILIYMAIIQLSKMSFRKSKQLSDYLDVDVNEGKWGNRAKGWLERKGITKYFSPSILMFEARKYGVSITKQSYMSTFLIGTVIGLVIVIIYFKPVLFILLPFSPLGGVIAVNLRIYRIKRDSEHAVDSKLQLYMSLLASALSTLGNLKDALYNVIPSLEDPVKEKVEEAYLKLQDGKSVQEAFRGMVQHFPHHYVRLYHDQLHVIINDGTSDTSSLRDIAFDMKKREKFRRNMLTNTRIKKKTWKQFVFFILSMPLMFIFVSMDNYLLVMNHIASSVVFALAFLLIGVTYWKIEQLEAYDPTEDKKAY